VQVEGLTKRVNAGVDRQTAMRAAIQEERAAVDSLQAELRSVERSLQERELTARQLEHEKGQLIDRYREEYEVDLDELAADGDADGSPEPPSRQDQEIAELRRKIHHLGAVNLEAMSELSDLESRHARLDQQLCDLTSAKDSLEEIIARINVDSRRMFLATIDVVRKHFQDLFRRLFGGGQADLVLEGDEDEDVLERGIEIVARPPGKEPRSISLLSGGEKTLTCVALLLAVFRSRPSPFCILDEVDAALDEANIGRFASVLREFLHATQFIVVTHSKRTMSFADTLYGITMQETGVSKPVSVRFDDRSSDADEPSLEPADETQAA
jgi:chromosome segregation protein